MITEVWKGSQGVKFALARGSRSGTKNNWAAWKGDARTAYRPDSNTDAQWKRDAAVDVNNAKRCQLGLLLELMHLDFELRGGKRDDTSLECLSQTLSYRWADEINLSYTHRNLTRRRQNVIYH